MQHCLVSPTITAQYIYILFSPLVGALVINLRFKSGGNCKTIRETLYQILIAKLLIPRIQRS